MLPLPKSDNQDVLFNLIKHRSLTSVELRKLTKCGFPPARCFDLRKLGVNLIMTSEDYINRRGQKSKITRYLLATPINEAKKIYKQLAA